MWQRKTKDTINTAIILLLLSLFVVKPDTGIANNRPLQILLDVSADLTIAEINHQQGKMKLALEKPYPRKTSPPKPTTLTTVSSITSYKPSPEPEVIPTPAEEIDSLIDLYANHYGADPNIMKIIAKCESGFRAEASNGSFGGMFQFMSSTWVSNRNAMGLDSDPSLRFNAEESIKTAAFKMGRDGYGAWPACSQKAFSLLATN